MILIGLLMCAFLVQGQEKQLNLPPGRAHIAGEVFHDLSWKLKGIKWAKEIPQHELQILKDITDEQLKDTSAEYRAYIQQGRKVINSLSVRAKQMFTEKELWYIYATDKKLMDEIADLQ